MLRNMVTPLIYHERIVTTTPKAKELKRLAEWMIGFGKDGKRIYVCATVIAIETRDINTHY